MGTWYETHFGFALNYVYLNNQKGNLWTMQNQVIVGNAENEGKKGNNSHRGFGGSSSSACWSSYRVIAKGRPTEITKDGTGKLRYAEGGAIRFDMGVFGGDGEKRG